MIYYTVGAGGGVSGRAGEQVWYWFPGACWPARSHIASHSRQAQPRPNSVVTGSRTGKYTAHQPRLLKNKQVGHPGAILREPLHAPRCLPGRGGGGNDQRRVDRAAWSPTSRLYLAHGHSFPSFFLVRRIVSSPIHDFHDALTRGVRRDAQRHARHRGPTTRRTRPGGILLSGTVPSLPRPATPLVLADRPLDHIGSRRQHLYGHRPGRGDTHIMGTKADLRPRGGQVTVRFSWTRLAAPSILVLPLPYEPKLIRPEQTTPSLVLSEPAIRCPRQLDPPSRPSRGQDP